MCCPSMIVSTFTLKVQMNQDTTATATLKTQIISAIDKYFFGPLLKQISLKDNLICITADHATPCSLKVHSDTPVPVLISGDKIDDGKAVKFSEKECAKGSLGIIRAWLRINAKTHGANKGINLQKLISTHRQDLISF